jgi:flotillin
MAEANKLKTVMEAEAEAAAIKIRGDAEAYAIQAKAKAEAEQMAKKAAAWNEYKSAAMIDMMLDTLPKVMTIILYHIIIIIVFQFENLFTS